LIWFALWPLVADSASFRNDRLLLKPLPGLSLSALAGLHAALGTSALRTFSGIDNLQVIQLPPNADVAAFVAVYRQSGLVEYVEPDFMVRTLLGPNDPGYLQGLLWNFKNTGQWGGTPGADVEAPDGWNLQTSAGNIIVAVIDTGARLTHQDLTPNLWQNPQANLDGYTNDLYGIDAIHNAGIGNNTDTIDPVAGHGTHVSGIIGAVGNNGFGVAGVAWQVQIMECRFLHTQTNQPYAYGYISDAITCIDFAVNHGAKIINASWGDYLTAPYNGILPDLSTSTHSQALHDAIASARDAGVIFVAAAGNNGTDNDVHPLYPASYYDLDNIIGVAATDNYDHLASWSNFGATNVALAAPGWNIYSCWNGSDSDFQAISGTSMAAAHVSGACAVVWSLYPNLTYQEVIARVLSGTDPLPALAGRCVTGGRLNLFRALSGYTGPIAGFAAGPLSGVAPLTVAFTNTSRGTIISWLWDFGDGTPASSQPNPAHTYNLAGVFTATLTITDSTGATSSRNQSVTVTPDAAGRLSVTPAGGFAATGPRGGPFSPGSQTYTLSNNGSASLNWTATVNKNWITFSTTSGTLAPGAGTDVTVLINANANKLKPGTYAANVSFNNSSTGAGNTTFKVTLQVR
jgi:subtilisin family serine protease